MVPHVHPMAMDGPQAAAPVLVRSAERAQVWPRCDHAAMQLMSMHSCVVFLKCAPALPDAGDCMYMYHVPAALQ